MTLRRAHRLNAIALAAFIALHIANHLFIFAGAEAHLATMDRLRLLYRLPGIEHMLVALFAAQIGIGTIMALRQKSRIPWKRAQKISGIVLALFLAQHIIAAIATRMTLADVDTNTYWAAAVVSRAPFSWYFVPYYTAGLIALGVHIAAILRFRPGLHKLAMPTAILSAPAAILIVAGFMGAFAPITLPPPYLAYIDSYWRVTD